MGLAIAASRDPRARTLGVSLLVGLILFHGLTGRTTWPFFAWHLYGFRASTILEFDEFRVGKSGGDTIRLDTRAVPPALPSTNRRIATRLLRMEEPARAEVAAYLIEAAEAYRSTIGQPAPVGRWFKFPAHQSIPPWDAATVGAMGPFDALEIHRVRIEFDEAGQHILARESEVTWKLR